MEIKYATTNNHTIGRNGRKIIAIVDHITAGLMPGCLSWMLNSLSQASAHYLITKQGEIYRLVNDADTAWHAGAVNKPNWSSYEGTNPNRYTIGIEHEGYPLDIMPEVQYQATLLLHRYLTELHNIPIDNTHIIGHYRIDSVNRPNCPGPNFPWQRLFNDLLKGGIDMALDKWMIEGGQEAIKKLAQLGMVANPEQWETEAKLAEAVPSYLFWIMLERLAERIEAI